MNCVGSSPAFRQGGVETVKGALNAGGVPSTSTLILSPVPGSGNAVPRSSATPLTRV